MKRINHFLARLPNGVLYAAGAIAAIWLFWRALTGALGPDPVDRLIDQYGEWALQLLIATLAITPLRALGLQATKQRRPLGLLSFGFAIAHFTTWLWLDHGWNAARIFEEILKRPFITIGVLTFALMLPLALTSNNRAIRKLGPKRWRRLHKLTYPIALLAGTHYLLVVKGWPAEPFLYLGVIIALLATRLPRAVKAPQHS